MNLETQVHDYAKYYFSSPQLDIALKYFSLRTLLIITSQTIENQIRDMSDKISKRGIKRLEVTMRDVLDGLEDAASYTNYRSTPEIVEILSIEPPGRYVHPHQEVIQFNNLASPGAHESANIVEYLIQRELRKSA